MSIEVLLLIGCVSGVAAGFFGIGGGVIIVPCLLLLGMEMEYAIGVSIMQMVFSSTFGSIINIYQKKLDVTHGIFVGLGGLMGAAFSGIIVDTLPSQVLLLCFLALSCISFYKYAFNVKTTANPTPPITDPIKQKCLMIGAGLLTGIFAVSLGVGGGLILAPILAYYLGFDSKKVVPISLFFIIFASISGSISLASHNLIDFQTGIIVGISSMFGVSFGIYLISKVTLLNHRYALIGIYAISILLTLWKAIDYWH
ncbi:sulfite exporter TauE/SafE family protein [Helicobacter marmotae]|uniref:Probable membrane transporter protein n=1 Tax=Helicobacter marmotae TaxID=152490 RepID=A0A3D8I6C0_9HELI|nr:sulfite exporter TauE/SafE family protein [Helicobacter marmotae]RDU60284.1 sulfite exporter TauE/SafE family protein [Helicobacter marmotae]